MSALKLPKLELKKREGASISKPETPLYVAALEAALLREFPASDAEEWDRSGLLVGDGASLVKKVAVALDPTVEAINEAEKLGANVLLTHHPAYLSAPDVFGPAASSALNSGACVWAAVKANVALMSFHTALDVSPQAARVLPGMLGLNYTGEVLVPRASSHTLSRRKGYGQLCSVRESDAPLTLGQLAARCTSVFGRQPRVWGNFSRTLSHVVTATGSAGDVVAAALSRGADCLVAGEVKYHAALDASQAGLCIIDLGHDVSELPLVALLADAVRRVGVSSENIAVIDQSANWTYPETTRL